jgi:AcrR family transcriptional regulator
LVADALDSNGRVSLDIAVHTEEVRPVFLKPIGSDTTIRVILLTMAPRTGTRERILKVSKSLFAARGYEHASTSSIARQAGTSESQLMKHFGNKAGLLEAIFSDAWSGIAERARLASLDTNSPQQKLQAFSGMVLAVMDSDPELKMLMLLEGRRIRREGQMVVLTDGFMAFVRLVDEVLEEMHTAEMLKPGLSPQAVRSALMGMLEGMLRDRFLAERLGYPANFDVQQIGAMLGIAMAACVKPPASAEAA